MEHSNGEMKHSLTSDHPICASQDDSANASSLSCSPQQSLDRVQHSGADTSSSPNPQVCLHILLVQLARRAMMI